MERPLYSPTIKPLIADVALDSGDADLDTAALYSQIVIDKAALTRHIRNALQERSQITLRELCEMRPLQQGLAELITYLQMAGQTFKTIVDEDVIETILWRSTSPSEEGRIKRARVQRVIFLR